MIADLSRAVQEQGGLRRRRMGGEIEVRGYG